MRKLALSLATLFILQVGLFAAEQSANVKFMDPVTVGSSTLRPGEYKVSWSGDGPQTQVTFSQGKKSLAVAPAAVVSKKNNDTRVFTASSGSGKVLQGIDVKDASLSFTAPSTSGK